MHLTLVHDPVCVSQLLIQTIILIFTIRIANFTEPTLLFRQVLSSYFPKRMPTLKREKARLDLIHQPQQPLFL